MTPRNVTENPRAYYEWLQWAMAGCPVPQGENGNNAKASKQTIEEAQTLTRDPKERH